MMLDSKGYFVDIYSENARRQYRTFLDPGELAKYVYNNKGPHIIIGGLDTSCKQEGAKIVRNVPVAIMKHGIPDTKKEWKKVAETAVEVS